MKRTLILLSTLLALAAFTHADSIPLTSGSGTLRLIGVVPEFTLQFHGSGYNFSIPGALDNPGGGELVQCTAPCDPFTIGGLLFNASGTLVNGDPYLEGTVSFNAVSFVSSIAPSGILTIKYTATLFLQLFLTDAATDLHIAGPFVWGSNEPWMVTAHYAPFPAEIPGLYTFEGATFTPVPEPGTIALLETGILTILLGLRRRLSRNGFPTRG